MPSGEETNDRDEIRLLLGKINDAWLKGIPDELPRVLGECFHDDMVVKGPDFQEAGRGKEACIRSYEDFLRQATVRECRLSEAAIDLSGNAAVATYSWEMTYGLGGQDYHESGHDLFVFTREDGKWLAVWRAVLVSPRP
jgi:hypothetical protein